LQPPAGTADSIALRQCNQTRPAPKTCRKARPPLLAAAEFSLSNSQLETRRDWNSNCVLITRSSSATPRGNYFMKTPWVFKAGARRALLYGMLILFAALTPPFILLLNSLT
jgi:hypothetical protein